MRFSFFPTPWKWRPREWLTKQYWVLETTDATFADKKGFSNADVDVVPPELRTWNWFNFMSLWIADGGNIGTMQISGSIMSLGLDIRQAIVVLVIGNCLNGVFTALQGYMGSRYHIPFTIATRASHGFWFSYFAVVSRLVLAFFYFGSNTYLVAQCTQIMIGAIWPSFLNIPNHIPTSVGITSGLMVAFLIGWLIQFPLLMIHPRNMRWLFFVKSVMAVGGTLAMVGWGVTKAGGGGPVFAQKGTLEGQTLAMAYVAGIVLTTNSRLTLAINIPDMSRYAKRPAETWWQAIIIPIVYIFFGICGILIASTSQIIYGSIIWSPLLIIPKWGSRAARFFIGFAFMITTIGTNIASNSVAAANDMTFCLPRYINLKRGAFIVSVLGAWAIQPWQIQKNAATLSAFLGGYTVVLGPLLGIMVTDFWLVHRGRLDVPSLYRVRGIYRYQKGVNWRAVVAYAVAVPINLPGLGHAVNNNIALPSAYINFYTANWFTGIAIASSIYMICCLVSPPTATLLDAPIEIDDLLPRQTVVEELVIGGGAGKAEEDIDGGKKPYTTVYVRSVD
ncbi:hypothetical protein L202_03627 [Cryptococcus amylolentus CBS 6039]|uniref:Allantoin permease n=1 Tax=Cryptococcus amylolentus CBS 6039 TaxID=1295533 RepID=A0A1E3HTR5_9TREE|nr:hypothetical protein L202_03627 [Cryptococcus amylolentus CBS 6039]ODN79702.1 hypothetical protein L202_03627 [Cryptococcus amylolentus CBS 6039]